MAERSNFAGGISELRALQIAVCIAGLVPVAAGLAGVVFGAKAFGADGGLVTLDSHVRYLSGLLLGIGLVFWSLVPRLDTATRVVRILTLIVFIGGLGRLVSLFVSGVPSAGMQFGLVMELVVTPLLCLWQSRVARAES